MKRKNVLAILLSIVMTAAMLTGCGNGNPPAEDMVNGANQNGYDSIQNNAVGIPI